LTLPGVEDLNSTRQLDAYLCPLGGIFSAWLPDVRALATTTMAAKEWTGLFADRLRGLA
jgi:hypothetical protein